MSRPAVDLKNRPLALLLAWMVPGLGHVYQGRVGKGILYGVCIFSLFLGGMALGDWQVVYWRWQDPRANTESFCFPYLFQFWAGLAALPALIQATLVHYGKEVIAWGFMAAPTTVAEISRPYPQFGKRIEIGSLYTMIAGLLNLLAMYDAYEGPANPEGESPAPATPKAPTKAEPAEIGASA
jgi:TM2 domain-containing membrane protein YozV